MPPPMINVALSFGPWKKALAEALLKRTSGICQLNTGLGFVSCTNRFSASLCMYELEVCRVEVRNNLGY